jgi:hypothetical protein
MTRDLTGDGRGRCVTAYDFYDGGGHGEGKGGERGKW